MSDLVERLRCYSYQQGKDDEQGRLINELVSDMHKAADEIERLRAIIAKWYDYWPEPWGEGRDGFEMQEFGEKHGILIGEERTTPCGKNCGCAEFFGGREVVTCYRVKPEYLEALVAREAL